MGVTVAKKERPSVSTRTADYAPQELPLFEGAHRDPGPLPYRLNPASRRIREALRRWFEEEL
jgi:hypothetical protein